MSLSSTNLINLFSLTTQNVFGKTQSSLGKSIEKLSSGLGINHSVDNPTGLAISEKMRSYIRGVKKATLNTQDAVSYLQTAEGATEEITSMLQRMRELAIQSANGTYTANDRTEIQKEMDQLKDEVDRIAQSTEFNTKKLLNGDSAGAWNSSNSKIGAVVTGSVAGGNYDISVDVKPGKNQIQETQIMSIKDGALGAEIRNAGTTNIKSASMPENMETSSGDDYSLTVANAMTAGDTAEVINSYFQDEKSLFVPGTITNLNSNESGYMVVEFTEDSDTAGAVGTSYRAKFISAETGREGGWVNFEITAASTLTPTYVSNNFSIAFEMPVSSGINSTVHKGDKFLIAVSDDKGYTAGSDLLASGGGTLTLSRNGVVGPTVTYAAPESLTQADNRDGVEDEKNTTLYSVALDSENGNVAVGSVTIGFGETRANNAGHGVTQSGTMTLEIRGAGEAATLTTKLSDIANFIDTDGNNILQTAQELRIYGNSKYAAIMVEAGDTVQDFSDKLTDAIVNKLDMGSDNAATNKKLIQYVPDDGGTGYQAVRGSMIIQTALTGSASELSFIGGQKMLDALGIAEIRACENNISAVSVSNHHTGELVGETLTNGERVRNIIDGIDITIDTRAGTDALWNEDTGSIEFKKSYTIDNCNMNLHIVDNRSKVQVGLQKDETVDITVPQLDTVALGIDKSVITSQKYAQQAIAELDAALTKVTSVRASIGAKVNRLNSTYSNLLAYRDNLTSSESQIRDTDIAAETTNLTAAQAMSQAGLAMLAQANQLPAQVISLLQ